jgi:aerobic-type carbon monoxide dehydrogenase small subunit (CoxS/CutS family)
VDGKAIRSCITPAISLENKAIITIEGLSENGEHPVQKAWKEVDVPQCGYCQSGQIMNAVGLLNTTSLPTDQEITLAMQGNICRCGTYPKIKKAIKLAAEIGGMQ